MNFRNITIVLLCFLTIACASKRPVEFTDYENNLIAPKIIGELVLIDKIVHENPLLGVSLSYQDKAFPEDRINTYIYPIREVSWEDTASVLNSELSNALKDVDMIVQYGHYKSREPEVLSDFVFTVDNVKYSGKKAEFQMMSNNDIMIFSDIYLFASEDKYIKFRTSFNSYLTKKSMGDSIVKKILPFIKAPPESIHMKSLRDEHKKKMKNDIMNLLLETLKKSDNTE